MAVVVIAVEAVDAEEEDVAAADVGDNKLD